jgi:RNA polymerase sigma-70 factor (ECF subfamily)
MVMAKSDGDSDAVDRAALAALYEAYAPVIYARCFRLLRSKAAARDALQETFVRVLAHNRAVVTGEEGLSYLYRVSTNICFNLLREQRVRARATPELSVRAPVSSSPEQGYADRQFALAVLDRCDDVAAAIAVLHYVDGMTQVEVAGILSITRRTVFNRLRKLESLAAELLQPTGQGRPDGAGSK